MAQPANKPRRTKAQIDQIIAEMYSMLERGLTDTEMQQALDSMPDRTFYHYKNLMYEKYGQIQRNKLEDAMAYQQHLLSERLTKMYKAAEWRIVNDNTTENNKGNAKRMSGSDFLAFASIAQELAVNILKLESEGLRSVDRNLNRDLQHFRRFLSPSPDELKGYIKR